MPDDTRNSNNQSDLPTPLPSTSQSMPVIRDLELEETSDTEDKPVDISLQSSSSNDTTTPFTPQPRKINFLEGGVLQAIDKLFAKDTELNKKGWKYDTTNKQVTATDGTKITIAQDKLKASNSQPATLDVLAQMMAIAIAKHADDVSVNIVGMDKDARSTLQHKIKTILTANNSYDSSKISKLQFNEAGTEVELQKILAQQKPKVETTSDMLNKTPTQSLPSEPNNVSPIMQ